MLRFEVLAHPVHRKVQITHRTNHWPMQANSISRTLGRPCSLGPRLSQRLSTDVSLAKGCKKVSQMNLVNDINENFETINENFEKIDESFNRLEEMMVFTMTLTLINTASSVGMLLHMMSSLVK